MADGTGTLERVPIKQLHPSPPRAREAGDEPLAAPVVAPPELAAPLAEIAAIAVPPRGRRRLLDRLRGTVRRPALAAGEAAAGGAGGAALDPLTLRQRLYGRGYVIPGDAAWVLALVEPFRLGASSALLDLAAGLGGPARTIAQAFHSRVTGIERDHERAQLGNAISTALGAAHLVRIRPCNPELLELDAGRFDCALGREASFAVAEKERFLRVVAQSLRARGQIVLTDFVLDRSAGERDELAAWRDGQARPASLWTAAQYSDCFKSLGFGLRRAEDISALYRRQIVAAWVGYLRAGEIRGLGASQIESVLAEAEACRRTVAALESGALKYYRFEAIAHYSFW
ncbi:MAG TPA: class I SAM-dependent methyltransferase [Stellaceae bacterium]|nr:class I SAM-dependent methyltransferase [Stellaceae bacterium]